MSNPRVAGLFVFLTMSTHAQWLHYPTPGTPRTRDGTPNLAAKAPRASNGKPDLSGVWQVAYAPPGDNERLFGDVFRICPRALDGSPAGWRRHLRAKHKRTILFGIAKLWLHN